MGQSEAIGLVVVVGAGREVPEVRRRARLTLEHVARRQQAQATLQVVTEAAAVAHLDRLQGDVAVVAAVDEFGHGVAVVHPIEHAVGDPVPANVLQLLLQVLSCGLVDPAVAAGIDLPFLADDGQLPLAPGRLDLGVAQHFLVDAQVVAAPALQDVVARLLQAGEEWTGNIAAVARGGDLLAELGRVHQ